MGQGFNDELARGAIAPSTLKQIQNLDCHAVDQDLGRNSGVNIANTRRCSIPSD